MLGIINKLLSDLPDGYTVMVMPLEKMIYVQFDTKGKDWNYFDPETGNIVTNPGYEKYWSLQSEFSHLCENGFEWLDDKSDLYYFSNFKIKLTMLCNN